MKLEDLKFTKEDFEMLIKGLEHLPDKEIASELMGDLMSKVLLDGLPKEIQDKHLRETERKKASAKLQKEHVKEECCILQSKLIQLRRFMESNNMIIEAQSIIDSGR